MILLLSLIFVCLAQPALAGPLIAAISTFASTSLTILGSTFTIGAVLGRLVLTVALAAYQRRKLKKALAQQSGIKTQFTGTGGTTPLTVIVGTYATNGHLEAPQASQPNNSSPPNKYMTYVVGLGDLPGMSLTGRVVVNDDWATLAGTTAGMEDYGQTVAGPLANKIWFRFRDGTETTADAFLLAKFGADPERPWLADMIGRGIPHVIVTVERDQTLFPGEPRLRFEVNGIPLYDPRLDDSVGGVGSQRWSNPATWAFTRNPKVIEYNIHRGLTIDGFGVWGGNADADDLPLENWFAAMNACDLQVDDGNGGTEPAYAFGLEFGLDQQPAEVVDEINRSCDGETVEVGGVYKTRVGGPGLPVYFFEDGDVIVSRPQELDPFPSLDEAFNAVTASFPDPDILWEAREVAPLTKAVWEAEDGVLVADGMGGWSVRPRRLLREITYPGVSNPRQVQRLIASLASRGRRGRSHGLTLPPSAMVLEPLDVVAWTSERNSYVSETFEVALVADPVGSTLMRVGLIEVNASDDTPPEYVPLPPVSTRGTTFTARPVEGFNAVPYTLIDGDGVSRRPALRLLWDGAAMAGVRGIFFEVRLALGQQVATGTVSRPEDGEAIVEGLLPATSYEVRARALTDRPSNWTVWQAVITPDIRLTDADLADPVQAALTEAVQVRGAAEVLVDLVRAEIEEIGEAAIFALAQSHQVDQSRRAAEALVRMDYLTKIVDEETARAALATEVSARIGEAQAQITDVSAAQAAGDAALAVQIGTVSASLGDLDAEVTQQSTALATVNGNLAASYLLRTRAGGATGEVEVVAADDPVNGVSSAVVIRSDRFQFAGDLAEFLGSVRITGDLIIGGALTKTYDSTFSAVFTATGAPQTLVSLTTVDQAAATTVKMGLTVQRDGTAGADFDWQLETYSALYFGGYRILASGHGSVPPGLLSGYIQEHSAVEFEHRDLPIGATVQLRILNLTNSCLLSGRLIAEQRTLV